ncbi:uncharacterized protein C8R40DRAFT_758704 [Lentinula edodes]|uniref:uncharacterized protein n=1 Tax=Lentinula edodes TaxID=5353 RepID=UPI001E8D8107|nr:uncharacterized protein C8R40DRAFT_758704 [Lentinula edodes]KAH7869145.1 hypothetical protein C8R40DRAFT_758704 [Lentinula edodes]
MYLRTKSQSSIIYLNQLSELSRTLLTSTIMNSHANAGYAMVEAPAPKAHQNKTSSQILEMLVSYNQRFSRLHWSQFDQFTFYKNPSTLSFFDDFIGRPGQMYCGESGGWVYHVIGDYVEMIRPPSIRNGKELITHKLKYRFEILAFAVDYISRNIAALQKEDGNCVIHLGNPQGRKNSRKISWPMDWSLIVRPLQFQIVGPYIALNFEPVRTARRAQLFTVANWKTGKIVFTREFVETFQFIAEDSFLYATFLTDRFPDDNPSVLKVFQVIVYEDQIREHQRLRDVVVNKQRHLLRSVNFIPRAGPPMKALKPWNPDGLDHFVHNIFDPVPYEDRNGPFHSDPNEQIIGFHFVAVDTHPFFIVFDQKHFLGSCRCLTPRRGIGHFPAINGKRLLWWNEHTLEIYLRDYKPNCAQLYGGGAIRVRHPQDRGWKMSSCIQEDPPVNANDSFGDNTFVATATENNASTRRHVYFTEDSIFMIEYWRDGTMEGRIYTY